VEEKIINNKMIDGHIFKNLFFYSLPIILSGILQLLYNAADLIVCGQFGSPHSTGAFSSNGSLINLIIQLFMGLSVGANVLMARCYGAKDQEKGQRVVYTSMIFSLAFGLILSIIGMSLSKTFLIWMKSPLETIDLSADYLFIYFIGLPFSMIYNFGAALFRAIGDTKRPFAFLALSGIINVLLNLLFVIPLDMDVQGVALATIISQGISAILIVGALVQSRGFFHVKWKEIRFYKKECLEVLRIGLPAGLQSTIFSLSNVLIQSSINSLGPSVVDGNGAASSLEGFIYTSMNSVAQAAVAFISANYGAGRKKNIKKTVFCALGLVFLMNITTAVIILLFHKPLLLLYIQDNVAIEEGTKRLFIISCSYFLCGFMDVGAYSLRGIGYFTSPAIISLIGACLLRIVWIYTLWQEEYLHNLSGLVISYPISWILTLSVHFTLFGILYHKLKLIEIDNASI
jgi:putative MATE family efflux protein